MKRSATIKKVEQALVNNLRDAGHDVKRPPCYREARFDERGLLVPSSAKELRDLAAVRASMGQANDASLLSQYQIATERWPRGKEAVIDARVALAMGAELPEIAARVKAFREQQPPDKKKGLPADLYVGLVIGLLMEAPPSAVTRAAMAAFHPFGLFTLLSVDVPPVERRSPNPDIAAAQRDMKRFLELLPVLRTYGARVVEEQTLTVVLTRLQQILQARVVTALTHVERERHRAKQVMEMKPTRATGWSTSAVEHRRRRLSKLVSGLRAAEPNAWPISRVVELVLACDRDWSMHPCPQFLEKYRERPEALEDLLKKDLSRALRHGSHAKPR